MSQVGISLTSSTARQRHKHYLGVTVLLLVAAALWYWYGSRDQLELEELPGGHAHLWSIGCSPRAPLLVTGSCDSELRTWDLTTRRLLHHRQLEGGWVENVSFRSDGRQFAVARQIETAVIFDAETLTETQAFENTAGVVSITFLTNADAIATGLLTGEVVIHSLNARSPSKRLTGDWDMPDVLAASPVQALFAIGAHNGVIAVVDAATSTLVAETKMPGGSIESLTFSPDGSMLAAGDAAGNAAIWNCRLTKKQLSWKAQDGRAHSLVYINEKVIVSADSIAIRFWDARDATLLRDVSFKQTGPVLRVTYCRQLDCLVVGFWHGALGTLGISQFHAVMRAAKLDG